MSLRRTALGLVAASVALGGLALGGMAAPGGGAAGLSGSAEKLGVSPPVGVVAPNLMAYRPRGATRSIKETAFAWLAAKPHPIERFESNGLAAHGKLWVMGGFGRYTTQASPRSDSYDPATDTWTRLADWPATITHAPAVLVGTTIWFMGGFVGNHPGPSTRDVWKYDTSRNAWSRGPSLPAARGAGGAAAVGGKIVFFGGSVRAANSTSYSDQKTTWELDTANESAGWKTRADLPAARNHLAGAALNGAVYAIGGQLGGNESGSNQKRVDRYDPGSNTWRRVADMPTGRGHITASAFAVDGRLIVAGGTNNGNVPSADMASYDPGADRWTVLPSLPSGRKTPVMGAISGRLVISTGYNGTGTRQTWISTTIPGGSVPPPPPPPPPPPGAYLQQADGSVVMEAENRHSAVDRSSRSWQPVSISGSVGGAVGALPDGGSQWDDGAATTSPELRFRVRFSAAGTYRLAVRVRAPDGAGNSLHVGLDGAIPASSDKISTSSLASWQWADGSLDGPAVATITVPSAGEHVVSVFAREDGIVVDRIVIARTGTAKPTGSGPPESPRG